MASIQYFQKLGWNISPEGYNLITKEGSLKDIQAITQNAYDTDIKEFGSPISWKTLDSLIAGPVILQIQKLRNISAPKSNENSSACPRMLKLILTDGHTTWQAIEYEPVSNVNLSKTPPGTKVLLKNAQITGSYILITNSNISILGGYVSSLVDRWQLSKSITKHVREGPDGPPPWVPFGQKVCQSVVADKNFKSLDFGKAKEQTKDEFEAQREEAIAEAAQGAVRKTFGGSSKPLPVKDNQRFVNNRRQSNKPQQNDDKRNTNKVDTKKKGGREKDTPEVLKPSGKISLFAFLEDKLPTTSSAPIDAEKVKTNFESTKSKSSPKPSYAEKYDASLRHQRDIDLANSLTQQTYKQNTYPEKNELNLKDTRNQTNNIRIQNEKSITPRSQNERPPRFQRTQQNTNYNNENVYHNTMEHLISKTNNLTIQSGNNNSNSRLKSVGGTNTNTGNRYTNMKFTPNRPQTSSYNSRNSGNINYGNNYFIDNNLGSRSATTTYQHHKQNNYEYNQSYPPRQQYQNFNNLNPSRDQHQQQQHQNKFHFDKTKQQSHHETATTNTSSNIKINSIPNVPSPEWQWKIGDQCMAKYWEDNQFYNASITGVTPRTCMVQFNDYGNFEEVLKADCIPLVPGNTPNINANRQYTGSLVFRRGGNGSQSQLKDYDRSNNNDYRRK